MYSESLSSICCCLALPPRCPPRCLPSAARLATVSNTVGATVACYGFNTFRSIVLPLALTISLSLSATMNTATAEPGRGAEAAAQQRRRSPAQLCRSRGATRPIATSTTHAEGFARGSSGAQPFTTVKRGRLEDTMIAIQPLNYDYTPRNLV